MTKASYEDVERITGHPSVSKLVGRPPESAELSSVYLFSCNGRELLVFIAISGADSEVHTVIPYRSRTIARHVFDFVMETLSFAGVKRMFTDIPDSRTALINMVRNLGFVPFDNAPEKTIYVRYL